MKMFQFKTVPLFLAGICLGDRGWAEPSYVAPNQGYAAPGPQQGARLVALRVVGSTVKNPQGEYLGRIEEATVNPVTGQIEFAMLQIHYPVNTTRVTPIPWKVLTYVWDQSQNGGLPGAVQTFNLNMSRAQLERAPTLDRLHWPDLSEAYWSERIFAYFGVVPGAGTTAAVPATPPPAEVPAAFPPYPPYEPGPYAVAAGSSGLVTDTNLFPSLTNPPPASPAFPGATNQIFNTNIFLNRTNFFLNRTNFFPGTRTPFNSDNPSTFPSAGVNTNFNPFVMTNVPPGILVTSNGSPFSPRFLASNSPALPAPVLGHSPWSPQFLSPQAPGQQLPIASQPSPWSPRFLSPDGSGAPPLVTEQPNPWSPRFLSRDPSGTPLATGSQPSSQFLSPQGPGGPLAANSQANAWSPQFLSPAASAAATEPMAPPPVAAPMPRRAPVIRAAPARRR